MIKILSVDKIREADQYTIKHEPIASIDLMERASKQLCYWLLKRLKKEQEIYVFCGPGNNGGDGLALSRLLVEAGYTVRVFIIDLFEEQSADFKENKLRLEQHNIPYSYLSKAKDFPEIKGNSVIIDAIFGSGLSRPIVGELANIVKCINDIGAFLVAIDMPSGLFSDQVNPKHSAIISADYTLTFELPKMAFFLSENEFFIGNWEVLPIGLSPEFLDQALCSSFLISSPDVQCRIQGRHKFSHKGKFGHGLFLAGSKGKVGAAILGARAALRSGIGLLSAQIPARAETAFHASVPEAMLVENEHMDCLNSINKLSVYSALAIGPGIGDSDETLRVLKHIIHEFQSPIILDADALNLISANKTILAFLPQGSIITPHIGELQRLVGKFTDTYDAIERAKDLAVKNHIYVILKGAYSLVACPDGRCFYNSTGNPGMATAGSGDVLTGILLGLLSQGYSSEDTCIMGTFLHGFAGDLAAKDKGYNSLIASDIIDYLPQAFEW